MLKTKYVLEILLYFSSRKKIVKIFTIATLETFLEHLVYVKIQKSGAREQKN